MSRRHAGRRPRDRGVESAAGSVGVGAGVGVVVPPPGGPPGDPPEGPGGPPSGSEGTGQDLVAQQSFMQEPPSCMRYTGGMGPSGMGPPEMEYVGSIQDTDWTSSK